MAKQMPTTENSNSTAPYIFGELAADVFALLIKPPNPPSRHPETTFPKSFVAVIPAAAKAPCASIMNTANARVATEKYFVNVEGGSGTSCFCASAYVSVANFKSDSNPAEQRI